MTMASANIVLDETDLRIPASALTLDGFRDWAVSDEFPERGRISFVQGEVCVDLSPEEIKSHNFTKADLFGWLWAFVQNEDLGRFFADRALLVNEAADLAIEPDIMFCLWNSLESGRVELREVQVGSGRWMEVVGSPDLVVEIISRSSVTKDTRKLRKAYHGAEIPEYWLIDARGELLQFTVLTWDTKGYVEAACDEQDWKTSTILNRRVKLSRHTDRVGNWKYKLHIQ